MTNEDIYIKYEQIYKKDESQFIRIVSKRIQEMSYDKKNEFGLQLKIDIEKEEEINNEYLLKFGVITAFIIILLTIITQKQLNDALYNIENNIYNPTLIFISVVGEIFLFVCIIIIIFNRMVSKKNKSG